MFALLSVNALPRAYSASSAAPHVVIEGGVAGNAAIAVLFAAMGVAGWAVLRRLSSTSARAVGSLDQQWLDGSEPREIAVSRQYLAYSVVDADSGDLRIECEVPANLCGLADPPKGARVRLIRQ